MSRKKHDIKELIESNERRLHLLQKQKAIKGISVGPEITIEIEDLQAEIKRLQKELSVLPENARDSLQYRQQVLLEISLIPHSWKNDYMALYPGHFRNVDYSTKRDDGDVWDMMTKVAIHKYSMEEWTKYSPLFNEAIKGIIERLEGLLTTYGDVVPVQIKLVILKTNSKLQVERTAYFSLQQTDLFKEGGMDVFFSMRFQEVIKTLANLSRLADAERHLRENST